MQVDERSLRRLVKKLTLLLASKDPESVASSRLSFKADLEAFRLQLLRLSSIAHGTSQAEIASYTQELSDIQTEQQQTQDRIDALKRKLQDVRRDRRNKLEYDVVAGEIVKLPTRAELEESLGRLSEQLDGVRAEREKYRDMSRHAATRMGAVIQGLEALRNDVGYEVGERERREVERTDGDADGEANEATTAGVGAGVGDDASESGSRGGRRTRKATGEEPEEGEEEEGEAGVGGLDRSGSSTPRRTITTTAAEEDAATAASLNPSAPTFRPGTAMMQTRRKRDSSAVVGSDEEGEVGDGSSSATAAASNSNTPRKRQRTEEGEVGAAAGDSEEEEGSIQPSTTAPSASRTTRAGTKRRR